MAVKYRKSVDIGGGAKVNIGKKSVGVSVGGKHGGVSYNSRTGARSRVSAPGTGVSYQKYYGKGTGEAERKTYSGGKYEYGGDEVDYEEKRYRVYSSLSKERENVTTWLVVGIIGIVLGLFVRIIAVTLGSICVFTGIMCIVVYFVMNKKLKEKERKIDRAFRRNQ